MEEVKDDDLEQEVKSAIKEAKRGTEGLEGLGELEIPAEVGIRKTKKEPYPAKVWAEIRLRYEMGESALSLSKKYKVAVSTITRKREKEGWAQAGAVSKKLYNKALKNAEKELEEFIAKALEDANYRHLKLFQNGQVLCHKMIFRVNQALNKSQKLSKEPYLFQAIVASLNILIEGERKILGINDRPAVSAEKTPIQQLSDILKQDRSKAGIEEGEVGITSEHFKGKNAGWEGEKPDDPDFRFRGGRGFSEEIGDITPDTKIKNTDENIPRSPEGG